MVLNSITAKCDNDAPVDSAELAQLLEKLYQQVNLDFSGYKTSSICRRIERRLRSTGSSSYQQYSDFLDSNPNEYDRLVEYLTINVTEFFRDDEPWHILKETVFPNLLSQKIATNDPSPLRIWSAGCASGQETYSIAILLNELVDALEIPLDLEIYGTDIDTACLEIAEKGQYRPETFAEMDQELVDRYFDEQFCVNPLIRKSTHFQRHDLVLDPPLCEMDCILCRNVAIYFSRDLQNKLFTDFYHGLRNGGYLFLGKAETLSGDVRKTFTPVNAKWKIFQKQ